jgi:hypothetical protein
LFGARRRSTSLALAKTMSITSSLVRTGRFGFRATRSALRSSAFCLFVGMVIFLFNEIF